MRNQVSSSNQIEHLKPHDFQAILGLLIQIYPAWKLGMAIGFHVA